MADNQKRRFYIVIKGLVQGVGFRPHVFNLAIKYNIVGWVRNSGTGVEIEAEGCNLDLFLFDLQYKLPELAKIDDINIKKIELLHETDFIIKQSNNSAILTGILPDYDVCNNCLTELLSNNNKYYLYPFLNCTHCGPRYSIINDLPYDRKQTSMNNFPMCESCVEEYENPLNRRFHAQPTACSQCGPNLSEEPLNIVKRLLRGEVVAIKSLGGYHLACNANDDDAVKRMREIKNREAKPFVVLVANIETVKLFAECSQEEEKLLISRQRPVVVLKLKPESQYKISIHISQELNSIGVMLPYTPLHYLLFKEAMACYDNFDWLSKIVPYIFVMTSANISGNPIIIDNEIAKNLLSERCDSVITHNRDIIIPIDDSVMLVSADAPRFIRRARSFAPEAIKLNKKCKSVIAVGSDLKNTFCITRNNDAFVSQHIGDLINVENFNFAKKTYKHLTSILQITPELCVCDLHPDYISSIWAKEFSLPLIKVQHHHAHIAAVCAEYNISDEVIGVSLDGFGFGDNHHAWGGELLLVNGANYVRIGHFNEISVIGGDLVSEEPWRLASSILYKLGKKDEIEKRFSKHCNVAKYLTLLENNTNTFKTSSAGRYFDVASALLGICEYNLYEGQAAMLLEALVNDPIINSSLWNINDNFVLDFSELFNKLAVISQTACFEYLSKDIQILGAELFHGTMISAISDWIIRAVNKTGVKKVVLSGGCFINKILLNGIYFEMIRENIELYIPKQLPFGDGAISLGQAWVAIHTN